jgi:rhomboid protease GluP
MLSPREGEGFFENPHAVVYLLIAANVAMFVLCAYKSHGDVIPAELLFRNGAMYAAALERQEYWRLVAYGFLHANLLHLATNMLCLALWGGHLEKHVGSFYFIVIYVCALVGGAIIGRYTHAGPYLTVGASGGISGVLGALLCLWLLAKIDVTANFFLVNVGLNVALAFGISNVDWGAHLGGFVFGLVACALIDVLERVNALVLRCKFPEFVKVNGLVVAVGILLILARDRPMAAIFDADGWPALAAIAVAGCVAVKLCDLLLSFRHGLAIIVVAFAAANAALAFAVAAWAVVSACAFHALPMLGAVDGVVRDAACSDRNLTVAAAAAGVAVLTLLVYARELRRGLKDVGFVAGALRAERKRHRGI